MKKLLFRGVLAVVLLLIIAGIVVFLMLNTIVKNAVETQGTKATGVATTLDAVELSPFSGALGLDDFAIANPEGFGDGKLFRFNKADVQVKLGSLMSDEVVVPRVYLDGAEVFLSFKDGKLNAQVLQENIAKQGQADDAGPDGQEPKPDEEGKTKGFLINDMRITNTRVRGELEIVAGQPPAKVDFVLADIIKQDVRGVEMADIIAFAVDTVLINSMRDLAQVSPDLDAFVGGLEGSADQALEDLSKRVDEKLPGAGELLNKEGKKQLDKAFGKLLGGDDEDESKPSE